MGYTHAFGNTEEQLRVKVLGCKQIGVAGDKAFDHASGQGWVQEREGDYRDGLGKGSRVLPVVVEAMGGVCPHAVARAKRCARTAGAIHLQTQPKGDILKFTDSFLTYHTRRISAAAVLMDAVHINLMIGQKIKDMARSASPAQ